MTSTTEAAVRTTDRGALPAWWVGLCMVSALLGAGTRIAAADEYVGAAAAFSWCLVPIAALPFTTKRGAVSFAHPWTVIFGLLLHGWVLRLTLAALDRRPTNTSSTMFPNGDTSIIDRGMLWSFVGIVCLGTGYALTTLRKTTGGPTPLAPFHRADDPTMWRHGRMFFALTVVALLAAVGMYFLATSGGSAGLIGKRFNDIEGGSASRLGTGSYAYLRLAYLSHSVFIVLALYRFKFGHIPGLYFKGLLICTFAGAILGPLMSDSRAGVALVIVDVVMLQIILSGRVRMSRLWIVGAAAVAALGAMLQLRRQTATSFGASILDIFAGRDLFDIGKNAHILQLPGSELGGQTLVGWLLLPFPQGLLPFDKPLFTGLGQYVWTNAYQASSRNGVPAGLIGELYLNFGLVGIIGGMLAFGVVIGLSYRMLARDLAEQRIVATVLMAIGLVRLIVFGLSNDLGTGVLSSLSDMLPILALLAFIVPRPRRSKRREQPRSRGRIDRLTVDTAGD